MTKTFVPHLTERDHKGRSLAFHVTQPMSDCHPTTAILENPHYIATVTYSGDFDRDVQSHSVRYDFLSAEGKAKGRFPQLMPDIQIYSLDRRKHDSILMFQVNPTIVDIEHIDQVTQNMINAGKSLNMLRQAIEDMIPLDAGPEKNTEERTDQQHGNSTHN